VIPLPPSGQAVYLDSIDQYRPHLLEGLPLYLYTLAKFLTSKGIPAPKVGVIKPFGGSLTPVMKQTIGAAFGCEVYDTYGCSELGFIACDCARHDGLHPFMGLFLVEVCRNGMPVAPGELGKLYITDLENRAMPWIRYDIGDVGRYYVDDHGCGRASIRLQVEGRLADTLINSWGEPFASDKIFDFFHSRQEIDNFQLVEKSRGNFELLCVPACGESLDRERIAQDFKAFFDPAAHVKAYTAKTIKAEDGGKFRFIKSKSYAAL
jgi:phenylacetate-CoA ligase